MQPTHTFRDDILERIPSRQNHDFHSPKATAPSSSMASDTVSPASGLFSQSSSYRMGRGKDPNGDLHEIAIWDRLPTHDLLEVELPSKVS
jgi:hypothetical protein